MITEADNPYRLLSGRATSPIVANRLNRTAGQCLFASYTLGFIFRLLADVGVRLLKRSGEVCGSSLSADVAIYAGRINVEGAGNVVLNSVVWIGHGSAGYADFSE